MQQAGTAKKITAKILGYFLAIAMVFTMMPLTGLGSSYAADPEPLDVQTPEVVVTGSAVIGADAYSAANVGLEKSYTRAELKQMDGGTDILYSAMKSQSPYTRLLYRASGVYLSSLLDGTGFDADSDKLLITSSYNEAQPYTVTIDPAVEYVNGNKDKCAPLSETRYVFPGIIDNDETGAQEVEPMMLAWANASSEKNGGSDPGTAGSEKGYLTLITGQLSIGDMNNSQASKYVSDITAGDPLDETILTVGDKEYTRADVLMMGWAENSYTYTNRKGTFTDAVKGVPMSVLLDGSNDDDVVSFTAADGYDMSDSSMTVAELIEGHYMLAYEVNGAGVYETAKDDATIYGFLTLYGDGANPAKLVNGVTVTTPSGIDFSKSPYKHITNGGITDQDGPYNIDAITSATLTVEGPGTVDSVPVSVRDLEGQNAGCYRGDYTDSRGGTETERTYEGIDLYYILHNMQSGTSGIKLTDKAYNVLIKNRNRKTIASLTCEQIEQMHNDGDPAIVAYGTSYTDGTNIRPFVFDRATGEDTQLGNSDGCLKFVYDLDGYSDAAAANPEYTRFGNMAYIYVEEQEDPGYKHDKEPYDSAKNRNYVLTVTGDEVGAELNYTVDQLESLVQYNEDGTVKDNGYGHRDEYSLANSNYWYVNEYEGVKLWSLLQRSGIPASKATDGSTVVRFHATDNYGAADSFTLEEVANPDLFGFYEKNAADNNDGTYEGNENIREGDDVTTGDKLRVGYPVMVAYGVNRYPYTISKKDEGYLSGLQNDGGPLRIIFGKRQYNHANGSHQAQLVDTVIVGDNNNHYSTHAYHPDSKYNSLKDLELNVVVNAVGDNGTTELKNKNYKISDIEDIIYDGHLSYAQVMQAKVKDFYEAGNNNYSDLYEGINLIYFLQKVVELNGTQGTVTFTSSDNSTLEISLDKLLETTNGYNAATGVEGLVPVLAYGKNGMPMVNKNDADRGAAGYVSSVKLAEGTDFENTVSVKNQGGPLSVILPREDKDAAATLGSLNDVVSIQIDLEADRFAHIDPPYNELADETLTVTGAGTRLTEPKEFTVSDLEGKQPVITTKTYSMLNNSGTVSQAVYKGLSLYDFLKSTDVGLKSNASDVIITCADGSSATFTLADIMKKDYINSVTQEADLPVMLAYGASTPDKNIKDGKPLVREKTDEGYDAAYKNNGGPLKLVVGQKDAEDVNSSSSLKDVVSINVTASEQTSWNHNSADVYKQYLNSKIQFKVVDENNNALLDNEYTLEQLEAMTDIISQEEIAATSVNVWEGLNLWQFIQQEAGTIEGINNPSVVKVTAKDGFSVDVLAKAQGLEGLIRGIKDGDNYVPILLAYAIDGFPLVPGGKGDYSAEGCDSMAGNNGGPIRLMVHNAQGACLSEVASIEIKVGGSTPPPTPTCDFNVQGVENGQLTIRDLKNIEGAGAEAEYTCKKSTDRVRGILLKDVLTYLGVTDKDATFTINACGYEEQEASYRDISVQDAIDQNYFVAYDEYNAETSEWVHIADVSKDDPTFTGTVRIYRNYNEALGNEPTLDWRNKCTALSGITLTIPEKTVFTEYEGTGAEGALPMAGLRATSMDMNGNLWVGTYGGGLCVQETGVDTFTKYNKGTTPALEGTTVSAVAADDEGGVWFAQNGSYTDGNTNMGLAYMKNGEITAYKSTDSPATIPDNYVQDIKIDGNGNVWIATFGGLTKYDPDNGSWQTWTKEDGLPAESASRIQIDADNGVWVGFYPDSEAADGTKPYTGGFAYLKDDEIKNVYNTEAPEDTSTGSTLYRLGDVWVRDIAVDAGGGAWIVASGSYAGMNNVGGTLWYVSEPGADPVQYTGYDLVGEEYLSGASNSEIRMVEFDPDGGLWFGTSGDGLLYIADPTVSGGKLTVTEQYSSATGAWSSKATLDNVYSLDFYGKTVYAGTAGGMLTHKFDFTNSTEEENPVIGDADEAEADIAITGAGAANDAYFSVRGLKNSGVTKLTKSYSWKNKSGTTGVTQFEGAYLENLLNDVVGLKSNAKAVKVISADGRTAEYDLSKLSAEDIEGNKIMLAWKEDGQNVNLKLVVGQYEEGEANKGKWSSDVTKIIVLAAPKDAVTVEDVIAAIDEIGDVSIDSQDAIAKARALYDRLDDEQKAQVTNYGDLEAAEELYEELRMDAVTEVGMKLLDDINYRDYDVTDMVYLWIMSQKYEAKLKDAETSDEVEAIVQEIQQMLEETLTKEQKAIEKLGTLQLELGVMNYNSVKIQWNESPAAEAYEVYRADKGSDEFTQIATVKSGSNSYVDKTVEFNAEYDYKVRPAGTMDDEAITGLDSNILSVKVTVGTPKFKKVKKAKKKITLKWTKVAGASGYVISRAETIDGPYEEIKTIAKGKTVKFVNKKLKRKTYYYYTIKAYRTVDGVKYFGDESEVKIVKTK